MPNEPLLTCCDLRAATTTSDSKRDDNNNGEGNNNGDISSFHRACDDTGGTSTIKRLIYPLSHAIGRVAQPRHDNDCDCTSNYDSDYVTARPTALTATGSSKSFQ